MSTGHSHIVTRGSMKLSHPKELDDMQERLQICKRESQPIQPVSQPQAKRISTNIEALRAAMREREAQEKLNNQ